MAKNLYVTLIEKMIDQGKLYLSYHEDPLNPQSDLCGNKFTIGYELRNYRIKRYNQNRQHIYEDENDHFIASLGYAILGYTLDFDPLLASIGVELYLGGQQYNVQHTANDRSIISHKLFELYTENKNTIENDIFNFPTKKIPVNHLLDGSDSNSNFIFGRLNKNITTSRKTNSYAESIRNRSGSSNSTSPFPKRNR